MVVKMMKWRPWPPLPSKKFEVKIRVDEVRGMMNLGDCSRFCVEIKWKGSKGISLTSLRKSVRRNFTKEELLGDDGVVRWDEEFRCFGSFAIYKDPSFHPWEVSFTLFNGLKQGTGNNSLATATLNLADLGFPADKQLCIPLPTPAETNLSLHLSIVLLELRNIEETSEALPRPVLLFPRSPCYGEMFSMDQKEGVSALKTSPRRVNIFKALSPLRGKRAGHEEEGSTDEYNSPLDSDTQDESDEGESEEVNEDTKSSGYGTLAYANHVGSSSLSNSDDEGWVYYSHQANNSSGPDHTMQQNSKLRILPWRKRKLSFRSPKVKGEPLLKKSYGEEGGDDIDFDRRQLSSSDESTTRKDGEDGIGNVPTVSAFGDDNLAVGIWEQKEITSRDGQLKLKTQVFFASIDQRNERAAGESACTALVAVIADWLQSSNDEMPIKSQLDSLIHEGSLEWRNLCENDTYKERFPDKHFDLETVVEARVRPLTVVPEKSFVGFFHPEGLEEKGFDFLQGAMSFDNIWDEICRSSSEMPPSGVYIISWNDHFFVLKVEKDAYYIIDTLGERLYEGCNQAFILKFDKDSMIERIANETQKSDDKPRDEKKEGCTEKQVVEEEPRVVCAGKESCKEYIKSFLAAIPIRELQCDLKRGLVASTLLHHRLQIEFHYTNAVVDNETKGSLPVEALEADISV